VLSNPDYGKRNKELKVDIGKNATEDAQNALIHLDASLHCSLHCSLFLCYCSLSQVTMRDELSFIIII